MNNPTIIGNDASINNLLKQATQDLRDLSYSSRLDSELLLAHILGKGREYLYAWPEKNITDADVTLFQQLVQDRKQGKPIAYITGKQEFYNLPFSVDEHTLIPRSDTECLIDKIIDTHQKSLPLNILDLGTGCGNIAISLAKHFPNANVIGTDQSAQALAMAKKNAVALKANITWVKSDWFAQLPKQRFDLIVSNPPYIASDDSHLRHATLRHEPQNALVSAQNGLCDLYTIIEQAQQYLSSQGLLLLEHGYNQAGNVGKHMAQHGYAHIETHRDLAAQVRCTSARGV